jgi:hypothetical protein
MRYISAHRYQPCVRSDGINSAIILRAKRLRTVSARGKDVVLSILYPTDGAVGAAMAFREASRHIVTSWGALDMPMQVRRPRPITGRPWTGNA